MAMLAILVKDDLHVEHFVYSMPRGSRGVQSFPACTPDFPPRGDHGAFRHPCSSKRRGDQARSSMPLLATWGAGSGQGGGSNRLCIGHRLDAKPSTDIIDAESAAASRTQLAARRRLGGGNRSTSPRQVISHTRRSSRYIWPQTTSSFRERTRWSIAPTDEFVGV
jgi:hypothetical protein